jgi:hypothetical protein
LETSGTEDLISNLKNSIKDMIMSQRGKENKEIEMNNK